MANRFEGFSRQGLGFLRRLVTHNDRDWFEERRATYEDDVRAPALLLAEELCSRLSRFAPDYVTEPARAVPRLARDRRFNPDLPPYKTWVSVLFGRGGSRLFDGAGFSVRVSAAGVTVGGGVFRPSRGALDMIRDAVDERHDELSRMLRGKRLTRMMGTLGGARLIRVPSPSDPDHPAADLLRHRQLYLEATLDLELAESRRLVNEAATRFRVMAPVVEWLAGAAGQTSA